MEEIKNVLEAERFIRDQVAAIRDRVRDRKAIGFLSGGVDSAVVMVLGNRAIRKNLHIFLIDNGIMRKGEIKWVLLTLSEKVQITLLRENDRFFTALIGKVLPYDKRVAIRDTFYGKILPELIQQFDAEFLFQGTNLTDIEATLPDSKAPQHNVLEQIGINIPGLKIVEPLKEIRKPSVREVAKALELPESIWNRMPFPGPALAARIDGEVTPQKVEIIRKATVVVEEELSAVGGAFQYFPVLISGNVPNYNRSKIGYAIAIRCVDSIDAVTARPSKVSWDFMIKVRDRIYDEVPEVFRVVWDMSSKPPAAIEWQ